MTTPANAASQKAYEQSSGIAQQYYGIALPAMATKQASAQAALAQGESPVMKDAFTAQRAGMTESIVGQGAGAETQMMRGSKSALSGGNDFSMLHPADIGAKLANALWGSKFTEGQADIENRMGLMSSIMGGSAAAGNAGLNAAGLNLQANQFLPQINQNYANITGAAAIGASIYGGFNQVPLTNVQQGWAPVWSQSGIDPNSTGQLITSGPPSWATGP